MQLSKRLQMSADFVTPGRTVADVGCDHAHMAIYLVQKNIADRVIAMDINAGPIARANENIARYGCEDRIVTRLSDGIEKLMPGEADTILCAGMGGKLIIHVLLANREAALAASEWVLQPQSEIFLVRRYIERMGYRIADERMCVEEGKFYTSIHAVKDPEKAAEAVTEEDIYNEVIVPEEVEQKYPGGYAALLFGEPNIRRRDPALYGFLKQEEGLVLRILESLAGQEASVHLVRRKEVEMRLRAIQDTLKLWEKDTQRSLTE